MDITMPKYNFIFNSVVLRHIIETKKRDEKKRIERERNERKSAKRKVVFIQDAKSNR